MLGYGGSAGLGPNRSKAFSMQADLPTVDNCSVEKSHFAPSQVKHSSPIISPSKSSSVRSLLLEPDMEDLTSLLPLTTDLNELSCPDEEEYNDSGPELEIEREVSRESFFSESIFCSFCSRPLSTNLLTQAV